MEFKQLQKQINKIEKKIDKLEKKLDSPASVLFKKREEVKRAEIQQKIKQLTEVLEANRTKASELISDKLDMAEIKLETFGRINKEIAIDKEVENIAPTPENIKAQSEKMQDARRRLDSAIDKYEQANDKDKEEIKKEVSESHLDAQVEKRKLCRIVSQDSNDKSSLYNKNDLSNRLSSKIHKAKLTHEALNNRNSLEKHHLQKDGKGRGY